MMKIIAFVKKFRKFTPMVFFHDRFIELLDMTKKILFQKVSRLSQFFDGTHFHETWRKKK